MTFIFNLPNSLDIFALFAVILFLSLIVGELVAKLLIIPRITGYIALGFLFGPKALNIVTLELLSESRILVDIALGLFLFRIGRHLDINWLRNDKGLFLTTASEFLITLILVASFITSLGWSIPSAVLGGLIAATTSPVVVLVIARDLISEGPVTRRTTIITSTNNFFAIALFTIILPFIDSNNQTFLASTMQSMYRFLGSIVFGILIFKIMQHICLKILGKVRETQFILFISVIMIAISISKVLGLSSMLVLLSIGIATRNMDDKNALIQIDIGWISNILFIPLFFITGCYLDFKSFADAPLIVLGFILLRSIGKSSAIFIFKKKSSITWNQAFYISLALTPMIGLAIGMTNKISDFSDEIGKQLFSLIAASVAILSIIGPIATQMAFRKSGEAFYNVKKI